MKIIKGEEKLPFLDKLKYEVDLMVLDPEGELYKWSKVGVKRFIVHIESLKEVDVLEQLILKYRKDGVEFGLAVGVDGPLDVIEHYINDIDFVQFMGIEKIGYQGQSFAPRVLDNIKKIRKISKDIIISVDGGVSFDTAESLINAGANRLVSGSVLFESNDMSETMRELEKVASGF